jgi:hypothetical protein
MRGGEGYTMRVGHSRHLTYIIAAATLLLSSCASFQRGWDQGNVDMVAKLINSGQGQKLAAMSATPFLVDGEIVALKPDVASFWNGIVKAGFKVEGATLTQGAPITEESYKQFAGTMEVKSFFMQYVKKDARILELRTATSGDRILLIFRDSWGTKTIYGFKGPF